MPNNKNQHFVPKCHLKPFSVNGEGKAINVFNLNRSEAIPAAPLKNQCSRDYFYGRDSNLERAIQTIEGPYSPVVEHIRSGGEITPAVELVLRRFMLLQHVRTEVAVRDGAEMAMAFVDVPGSDIPLPSLRERTELAVQASMFEFRNNMYIVDDLKLRILRNATDRPFITSDNPAVFTNRLHHQRLSPRWSFGWKTAGAILIMPLAPDLLAILFDGDVYSMQHGGRRVETKRRSDVEALNEHQFLNLKANAYFADWQHRDIVAEASADAATDLLPGNHAIGKLARQMETSDAARPIYRGSDHWRAARA